MQSEKQTFYRIEWILAGEHQVPPGLDAHGFGGPLTLQEAQDIVQHYHPKATQSTFLRYNYFDNFKILGLTHRIVMVDHNPNEPPGGDQAR